MSPVELLVSLGGLLAVVVVEPFGDAVLDGSFLRVLDKGRVREFVRLNEQDREECFRLLIDNCTLSMSSFLNSSQLCLRNVN